MEKIPFRYSIVYFDCICILRKALKYLIFFMTQIIFFSISEGFGMGSYGIRQLVEQGGSAWQVSLLIFYSLGKMALYVLWIDGLILAWKYFKWLRLSLDRKKIIDNSEIFGPKKLVFTWFFNLVLIGQLLVTMFYLIFPLGLLRGTENHSLIDQYPGFIIFDKLNISSPILVYLILIGLFLFSKKILLRYFHKLFAFYLVNYFDEYEQDVTIQTYFNRYFLPLFKNKLFIGTDTLIGNGNVGGSKEKQVVQLFTGNVACYLIGGQESIHLQYYIEGNQWYPFMKKTNEFTYRGLMYQQVSKVFSLVKIKNYW